MFYKTFYQKHFLLVAALSLGASTQVYAQNQNDFFEKNSALTIFDDGVTDANGSRFRILKQKDSEKQLALAERAKLQEQAIADEQKQNSPQQADPAIQKPVEENKNASAPESIISKYGDPTKDAPVLAQDNAPTPFKGMMAALDGGNDELAFQYARQYVRHMSNLQQRTKRAVTFQALAMEKEGMLPEKGWQNNPQFESDRILLKDQLADDPKQHLDRTSAASLNNLDPKARAILEKASALETGRGLEEQGVGETISEGESTPEEIKALKEEKQGRLHARAAIKGKTPVDPKGEVDVYFFFRANDKHSIAMGYEIQKLYGLVRKDPKVRLVGLTLDLENDSTVQTFRFNTRAGFSIANGSVLAKKLNIKTAPTVVTVARTNGNAIVEEGYRKFYYLDELVKYMQGKAGQGQVVQGGGK